MSKLSRDLIEVGVCELDDAIYDLAVAHNTLCDYDAPAAERILSLKREAQSLRDEIVGKLDR